MSEGVIPIFKLLYKQLEALLPIQAFGQLETAVTACCHAMNNDQSQDESSELRAGLKASLDVLTTPLETLTNIRQWALDCLQDEALLQTIQYALPSPALPNGQQVATSTTRSVTARQARGILANVFFANCHDPMQRHKDSWNVGGLDWRPLLYTGKEDSVGIQRMRCHLLYFATPLDDSSDANRIITFERIRFQPVDMFNSAALSNQKGPVADGMVIHNGPMESPSRPFRGFVNFANPNFGYVCQHEQRPVDFEQFLSHYFLSLLLTHSFGKFICSCTQEEILESCCPEFMVGLLWIGLMQDDEVVNVRNVRRFCQYSGYLGSFQCQGPLHVEHHNVVLHDILTMDAVYERHFRLESIQRDVNKALAVFRGHAAALPLDTGDRPVVSTGKWGCGAFGGLPAHKFVQQVLAAHLAGVDLDFSAFGDPQSCDVILQALQESGATAPAVARALQICRNKRDFVTAFVRQVKDDPQGNTDLVVSDRK